MRMIHYRPPGGEQKVRHRRHCSCSTHFVLKGTVSRDGFGFDDMGTGKINRKKYVNGSVNSEGHFKNLKPRRDASLGLHLSIYIFISPANRRKGFHTCGPQRPDRDEQ